MGCNRHGRIAGALLNAPMPGAELPMPVSSERAGARQGSFVIEQHLITMMCNEYPIITEHPYWVFNDQGN